MDKQPEALRLADELESEWIAPYEFDSAAELRRLYVDVHMRIKQQDALQHLHNLAVQERDRLHTQNQELVEELNAAANYIDTLGGVSASYRQKLAKIKEQA
jgi:hypothetical protein